MDNRTDIHVLNDLITGVYDSIDGYRTAGEHTENPQFSDTFITLGSGREELVQSLKSEVLALGGVPEDEGSLSAAAHRGFMRVREAVMSDSDKQVVAEVDRGEDHLKEQFLKALARDDLSPGARNAIQTASNRIQADHVRISEMRKMTRD